MNMKLWLVAAFLYASASASAQSLRVESPSPLQAGINKSTVDNFVGTQYWYFIGGPGKTHVHVQFTPMGLLGNANHGDVTVTLFDEGRTWHTAKVLSSDKQMVEYTFEGDLKAPTKVLVSVAPPSGGLVRTGGDYELLVTGNVKFAEASISDPAVGTYNQMAGYTALLGACKFTADGKIESTSGAAGTWKLFDKDSQTYVINIDGQERKSLQLKPGRGLCDGDIIIFQAVR